MKYLIWGVGERAARIFYHLGVEQVVAFIDSDQEKIGKEYLGKKVIGFEDVKKSYFQFAIIISPLCYEDEIVSKLESNGISHYLSMKDCPGDYQDPNPRDYLKNHILKQIKPDLRYIVYGNNLYGLNVYEWIKERCNHCPLLLLPENTNDGLIRLLRQSWGDSVLTNLFDKVQYDVIFDTERKALNEEQCKKRDINFSKKMDIFDCASEISEYYHENIRQFKNIHKDKRCFIVALGPSLKICDLDTLYQNQEICVSMNTIWNAFDKTKWRPTYYVAEDYRIMRGDYGDMLNYMKNGCCFIGDTNAEFCKKAYRLENVFIHHVNHELSEDIPGKFSEDFSRNCYVSATVTNSCIQLAVYMGFREIYLLGVDFSYGSSKYEKYTHFYPDSNENAIGFRDAVYMGYLGAKNYADEHDINIYNATRGGKLELFERVDFDSLF